MKIIESRRVPGDEGQKSFSQLSSYFESLREGYEFRHYLMGLMGDGNNPADPEFMALMRNAGVDNLANERNFRSFVFQDQIKQFFTNLTTNITHHMYKRLRTYLTKVAGGLLINTPPLSRQTAREVLAETLNSRKHLSDEEVKEREARDLIRFGVKFTDWREKPLRLIPLLVHMQRQIFEQGLKSFTLIPQCSPKARNIEYTKTALHGLLKRVGKESKMNETIANARTRWLEIIDVTRFECGEIQEDNLPRKRFDHIETDGVACHVKMVRVKREGEKKVLELTANHKLSVKKGESLNHGVPNKAVIIAIDEGFLAPWAGVLTQQVKLSHGSRQNCLKLLDRPLTMRRTSLLRETS